MKAILCSFFCLVTINLMADVNTSNAVEQGEDLLKDRYAEYYSYFHGTWEIEITKDGETETRVNESRPSQGGTSISIGENHTALWGTNPANGQRVGVSYQEDGSRLQMWMSKPKDEMIGPGTTFKLGGSTFHVDGTVTKWAGTFTCIDENHYEMLIKGTTADGESLPDVVRTGTRMNSEPPKKRFRLFR